MILNRASPPIYIRGKAATFIPNSSFEQSFHSESKGGTPYGLTLNPTIKAHPALMSQMGFYCFLNIYLRTAPYFSVRST